MVDMQDGICDGASVSWWLEIGEEIWGIEVEGAK